LLDPGKKVSRHMLAQNTGSLPDVHPGFRCGETLGRDIVYDVPNEENFQVCYNPLFRT
jgi:hypothetical protein